MRISRRLFIVAASLGVASAIGYIVVQRSTRVAEVEGVKVEEVATNLAIPWSISFISPDEALLTERGGTVRLLDLSAASHRVIGKIDVAHVGEGGLLGIDTRGSGPTIYTYYTARRDGGLVNRVVLWDGLELRDGQVLLDNIPASSIHNGGRIRLGPDGKLYITTGDAAAPENSQSLQSLAGKILRLNPDGSIPPDNPYTDSPIYSLGHRNPQGIDWHPVTLQLYSTEHGPSGEMGLTGHDEVNIILPGANYGWPRVIGAPSKPEFVDPIYHSGATTWAPSGCSFVRGAPFEDWANNLLFAALRGEHLHRVVLDTSGGKVVASERLFQGVYGRLRDVVQGPDGYVYLLTSNRDGRGVPRQGDDKVLRLTPI